MNACMVIKAVASFLNLQLTDKNLLKEGEFYVINSRIFKQETVNYCLQSLDVRKYARAILSV